MATIKVDYVGQKFGRLTVQGYAFKKGHNAYWACSCECGGTKIVATTNLRNEHVRSCGCLNAEAFHAHRTTHGMSKTPEFKSWWGMISRCKYDYRNNPNSYSHRYYLDRGITVCDRWADSFENFLFDMGQKPTPKHSLDRINNDAGYSPENCRWATAREQALNRRNATILEYKGEKKNMALWAEQLGVTCCKLRQTIDRMGSEENAIDYFFRGCA